jgi:hypothetical protein
MTHKEAIDLAVKYCEELRKTGAATFIPRDMSMQTGIKETAMSSILLGVTTVRINNVVLCDLGSLLRKYRR